MAADPVLSRLERAALVWCLGAAAVAMMVSGGRPGPAFGVVGGGLLAAVSYWTIRTSADAVLEAVTPRAAPDDGSRPSRRRSPVLIALLFAGRYALLGFLAYVMIARLRLHPIGLFVGASSMVAAAVVEAARAQARGGDAGRSR